MIDPLIREIRQIKTAIAGRHGNDVKRLLASLRKREKASGRKLVTLRARKPKAV